MRKLEIRLYELLGLESKYDVMVVGKCEFAPIICRRFNGEFAQSVSVVYNHMKQEQNIDPEVFVDLKGKSKEDFEKDLSFMYRDIYSAIQSKEERIKNIKNTIGRIYDGAPHESFLLEALQKKVTDSKKMIQEYREVLDGIDILRQAKPSDNLYRVEEKS